MHAHTVEKHPTVAFLLSLLPGVGHLYLGKYVRTLLYGGAAIAPLALFVLFTLAEGFETEAFIVAAAAAFFVWCVNMIDMAITLTLRRSTPAALAPAPTPRRDRTTAALLSLLPGVGHIYLGRSRTGLTLLLATFASMVVPFGAALVLGAETLLLGWLAVPALVVYAAIDAVDRATRNEFESWRAEEELDPWFAPGADGRRPVVACFLSIVPGVGHLYIGSLFVGLRLLGASLLLLFLKQEMGLNLAVYAMPVVWGWAFFDVLRRVSPNGWSAVAREGEPPFWTASAARWSGAALIVLGAYLLFDRIAVPTLLDWLPNAPWAYGYRRWAEPMFAALLFFGIGFDLLRGRSRSAM
jgi:TM2 domain-containing membrane protein YozV